MLLKKILTALFLTAAFPAFSQVVPAARGGDLPLVLGVGASDFDIDYGRGQTMKGISAWADWNFYNAPSVLRGMGIEIEGHDINYGRTSSLKNARQDTIEAGGIYTWRHYRNFYPYAKFLAGLGSADFRTSNPKYSHDTFTVYSPGGGLEYRAWQHIWVRGDYEYQFWHHFNHHDLTPHGFTIGASYEVGHSYER